MIYFLLLLLFNVFLRSSSLNSNFSEVKEHTCFVPYHVCVWHLVVLRIWYALSDYLSNTGPEYQLFLMYVP